MLRLKVVTAFASTTVSASAGNPDLGLFRVEPVGHLFNANRLKQSSSEVTTAPAALVTSAASPTMPNLAVIRQARRDDWQIAGFHATLF